MNNWRVVEDTQYVCVKCGNCTSDLRYIAKDSIIAPDGVNIDITENTLRITCDRCNFSWFEKPLDEQKTK